uniref:Uncharacterized protein n=1 Tax=Knipowitschia caucasica TaxID=637954 RepID=A0AAV2MRL1_KNICA
MRADISHHVCSSSTRQVWTVQKPLEPQPGGRACVFRTGSEEGQGGSHNGDRTSVFVVFVFPVASVGVLTLKEPVNCEDLRHETVPPASP